MKFVLLAFTLTILNLFSNTASAHVEPGTFSGKTPDGTDCFMVAGKTEFIDGLKHPLNERIPMTVGTMKFTVNHPTKIDSSKGTVTFDHDLFQGLLATKTGANAIEIVMEHSGTYEGPRSFTVMEDSWAAKKQVTFKCLDLKHVAP